MYATTLCCLYSCYNVLSGEYAHLRTRPANVGIALLAHNHTTYYQMLCRLGLYSLLNDHSQPRTLFLPRHKMMTRFVEQMTDREQIDLVKSLTFPGEFNVTSLIDGARVVNYNKHQLTFNKHFDLRTMKLRTWLQGLPVKPLHYNARNVAFYLVKKLVVAPRESIWDYLENDSYSIMRELFTKYKLYFQFTYGTTLFLPRDVSLKNLPSEYTRVAWNGSLATRNFLRNHIINRPMCRQRLFAVNGWSRMINDLGKSVDLYQDSLYEERSFVHGHRVVTSRATKEGWVYPIDGILLSGIEMDILETLSHHYCHKFLRYLTRTGHTNTLRSILWSFTFFAPSDTAFDQMPEDLKEKMVDAKFFRQVLNYHVVEGRYITERFSETNSIKTSTLMSGNSQPKRILNVQRNKEVSTVQDVEIISPDILSTNGIIHVINQVMIPPNRTIADILRNTNRFRLFADWISNDPEIPTILERHEVSYTLFVPTNRAVRLYETVVRAKKNNITAKNTDLLKRHIALKAIFTNHLVGEKKTLETLEVKNDTLRTRINVDNTKTGQPVIREYNALLLKQNIAALNGVIHAVEKVLSSEVNGDAYEALRKAHAYKVKMRKRLKRDKRVPLTK